MFIKICGITRVEDAIQAAELGVDAIGLNFFPKSKRFIDNKTAMEICAALPKKVLKIGLFVNSSADEVNQKLEEISLDLLQFHGDETPEFCSQWGGKVIRAISPKKEKDLEIIKSFDFAKMIIVDASVAGQYGGTGEKADWEIAKKAVTNFDVPILLAGGLTPENVAEAIKIIRPFGVDVAGGVESSPGLKDFEKMKKFVLESQ